MKYIFRKALADKVNQEIVVYLNKNIDEKSVDVYLPYLSQIIENYNEQKRIESGFDTENYESVFRRAHSQADSLFLVALEKEGVIKLLGFGDDDYTIFVKIKNKSFIRALLHWIEFIQPYLDTYGITSIDTSSGDVYCLDEKSNLNPNKGMYKILKEMIKTSTHRISYERICLLRDTKNQDNIKNNRTKSEIANQVVKDIKKALHLNKDLKKIIRVSDESEYILLPDIPSAT